MPLIEVVGLFYFYTSKRKKNVVQHKPLHLEGHKYFEVIIFYLGQSKVLFVAQPIKEKTGNSSLIMGCHLHYYKMQ